MHARIDVPPLEERIRWFQADKLGLFVHWGCYSVLGRGEQIMVRDLMPLAEYEPLADRFQPAADWAEQLAATAVDAGLKYVVLTTRHHDGYCLFETGTHEFNAARTGPGRDLVAEFVRAMRAAGLKVGFYYSVHTWRWHGFWDPKGYPEQLPQIVEEMHTQVRELMTNYGKIDILWYDVPAVPGSGVPGGFTRIPEPIDQSPAEFYRSAELNAEVRKLQPHILINNRSGVPEDYGTPEQRVRREEGDRPWETCMTLNNAPNWGYLKHSMADKTAAEVLYQLVNAVRQGGNFLLNVGPNADGYVDEREGAVLRRIGRWLDRHGEAIYDTRPNELYGPAGAGHPHGGGYGGQGHCYHYGMFTTRDTTAYMTLFYYPGDGLIIAGIAGRILSAEMLTTGRKLKVEAISNARWKLSGLCENPPDPLAPVIKLEFATAPRGIATHDAAWLDGEVTAE
jgi:alpha-L-fucosidase